MDENSLIALNSIGGIDYVRPPTLKFLKKNETDDYTEFKIITEKNAKKKLKTQKGCPEDYFTNYLDSFIFCKPTLTINVPKKDFMIKNGKKKFAYAVGMFPNPKNGKAAYLDGCILSALGLKRQGTNADIICFITPDISKSDKKKLEVVFDKVFYVPYISPYDMPGEGDLKTIKIDKKLFDNCPNYTKQHPYVHVFFKLHIFNPDLFPYEKVCFVDSDLVPLNYYDSLFMLDCPAGFVEYRKKSPYLESYQWDRCDFLEHGEVIPKELTDIDKPTGADVNAGLLLVKPDKAEYESMIKELSSPLETWMGPKKKHKGFFSFDFNEPTGMKFIENSYCYPEQNYLTKRYSGKWKFIEFAFQSWSRDPCNSFGIHMAAFNPKPWFKQPIGTLLKIDEKYQPYLKEWDKKNVRFPIALNENEDKNYENISFSYEMFNEVIVWGMVNYPKLKDFFVHQTQIHGLKVSFDRDVFKNVEKNTKFKLLKDIKKGDSLYRRLSKSQKQITDLINDYDKNVKKIKDRYLQICRSRLKDRYGEFTYNFKILEYPDHIDLSEYQLKKFLKKNKYPFGNNKGKLIKDLDKDFIKKIIETDIYKGNKEVRDKILEFHKDYILSLKKGGKKTLKKNKKHTLYYFGTDWCHYCKMFNPIWKKLTKSYKKKNIIFKKILIDDNNQHYLSKYSVHGYPSVVLEKNDGSIIHFDGNNEDEKYIIDFLVNKV